MNTTKPTNKFTRFLRNNAALLILIFCVLAIAAVVLAVTLTRDTTPDSPIVPNDPVVVEPGNNGDNKDPEPVVKDKIKVYFSAPFAHTNVSMGYTDGKDSMFVFNSTLNDWAAHNGVDLIAADGTAVNAMYDGTVIDVTETFAMGNIVTIDHGDNVVATYASLSDVKVVKGQTVKKGDQIGAVSTTASNEFMDGAHLHLEVAVSNKNVDPMPYVNGEIFREFEAE